MKMSRWTIAAVLVAALFSVSVAAQAAPAAKSILEGVGKALDSMKTMQIRQSVKQTDLMQSGTTTHYLTYLVQKPDKIRLEMRQNAAAKPLRIVISDGKKLWAYSSSDNKFMVQPKPKSLDMLMPNGGAAGKAALTAAAKNAAYVGTETIRGKSTHIIRFTQDGIPTKMWIGVKDSIIYRVMIDLTAKRKQALEAMAKQLKQQMPKLQGKTATTTIDYLDVQINKTIPASAFRFSPPKGATELKIPTGPPPTKGAPVKPKP